MDIALRDELVAMEEHDQAVRAELAADGTLFHGYHPRMEAVQAAAEHLRLDGGSLHTSGRRVS